MMSDLTLEALASAKPGDRIRIPSPGRGFELVEFVSLRCGYLQCKPFPSTDPDYIVSVAIAEAV